MSYPYVGMKPIHKHRDLIIAWANGAEIECRPKDGMWIDCDPSWSNNLEYRIKPEPRPDYIHYIVWDEMKAVWFEYVAKQIDKDKSVIQPQIAVTYDGNTNKPKSAEMAK